MSLIFVYWTNLDKHEVYELVEVVRTSQEVIVLEAQSRTPKNPQEILRTPGIPSTTKQKFVLHGIRSTLLRCMGRPADNFQSAAARRAEAAYLRMTHPFLQQRGEII